YAARVIDRRLQPTSIDIPALTAPLTRQGCVGLSDKNWAVDASRAPQKCDVDVRALNACQVELRLTGCAERTFIISEDPADGALCGEVERAPECVSTPDAYAPVSFDCGSDGRFHVYPEARTLEAPFTVDRIKWRDGPAIVPGSVESTPWVHVRFLRSSYGIGMVALQDRVVISAPGSPTERCGITPGSFYSIDTDTLDIINIESGRACARTMSPDPDRQTFLATFHDGETWRIGRFNPDGQLLADEVVVDALRSNIEHWRPQAILRPPNTEEVWVLFNDRREIAPLPANVFVRVNASTLVARAPEVFPTWQRSFAATAIENASTFALVSEWEPTVGWFVPDG
ncbi:MAG: hypothetical protein AAFV29_27275, partial [Myxococcota bacterium]